MQHRPNLTGLRYRYFVYRNQPRSQGLSSLPPVVVGTEALVAAGHVTTQTLGGRKICWKGGATWFFIGKFSGKFTKANVLEYPPTLRIWMDRWSRDQPQPGRQRRETLGTRLYHN